MPVYNGAAYLRPAVDSILAQTFADLELVLSDDGSSDDSRSIVEEYAARDPRVVAVFSEHGGVAAATNRALAAARGEYFAPMDHDDVALPERLAREVAFLDANPDVAVIGSGSRVIDGAGRELKSTRAVVVAPDDVAEAMHRRCAVLHPSCMMRTEVVRAIGGYRPFLPYAQDYDLFLRIMARHRLANIPDVLLLKRTHATQVTGSVSKRPAQIVAGAIVYLSHLSRQRCGSDIFHANEPIVASAARFIDTYLAENPRLDRHVLHHVSRFMRYAPLAAERPRRLDHPYLSYFGAVLRSGDPREVMRSTWYAATYFARAGLRHGDLLAKSVYPQ